MNRLDVNYTNLLTLTGAIDAARHFWKPLAGSGTLVKVQKKDFGCCCLTALCCLILADTGMAIVRHPQQLPGRLAPRVRRISGSLESEKARRAAFASYKTLRDLEPLGFMICVFLV